MTRACDASLTVNVTDLLIAKGTTVPARHTRSFIAAMALIFTGLSTGADAQTATPAAQEAACNANDAAACTAFGVRLTDGAGIAKDQKRGADLFLKACNLNNGRGCMLWGYALSTGRGAYVNAPQAASYYEKSCKLKYAIGCNNHGIMFRDGRGEVKNEIFALSNFENSCRLGFAEGCRNEGVLHADATTMKSNRILAVVAFDKGCTLGDLDSCNKQAWHVQQGLGTQRDLAQAEQLYVKACLGGFELACKNAQLLTGKRPEKLAAAPAIKQAPAGAASAVTTPSNPAVGPMVCSAFMTEGNKMFLAWGFSAAGTRSVELARAFAQMLREKRYAAASMYAPAGSPPPDLTVDCRWHETADQAAEFKDKLIAGAARNRITYVPTTFNPF